MRKLVNMRLDEGLLARVDSVCGPRGQTEFVARALEAALSGQGPGDTPRRGIQSAKESGSVKGTAPTESSAPPQVPSRKPVIPAVKTAAELMAERQARLNKARGS